jgi:hypothetical protein
MRQNLALAEWRLPNAVNSPSNPRAIPAGSARLLQAIAVSRAEPGPDAPGGGRPPGAREHRIALVAGAHANPAGGVVTSFRS